MSSAADATIPEQPNVVLINAGTNDCIQNYNVSTAHERMRSLVEKLFAEIPGTTVVLSTLLPNAVDSVDERVDSVNEKFRELVATLSSSGSTAEGAEGQRIVLAEMNNGYITRDELVEDGIHPNKEGYNKMAARVSFFRLLVLELLCCMLGRRGLTLGQHSGTKSSSPRPRTA